MPLLLYFGRMRYVSWEQVTDYHAVLHGIILCIPDERTMVGTTESNKSCNLYYALI